MANKRLKSGKNSYKLQGTVTPYTLYVLENLIGIKGTSEGDVADHLIQEWITEHHEELKGHGITSKESKKDKELWKVGK